MLNPRTLVKLLQDRENGATYELLSSKYGLAYKTVFNNVTGKTDRARRAKSLLKKNSPSETVKILQTEFVFNRTP